MPFPVTVLVFAAGSIVEIYSLLYLSSYISTLNTISWTMFTLLLGVILGRGYGAEWFEKMQWHLRSRSLPADEVVNGAVVRVGSILLLTPGAITDFLGLVIALPKTRFIARKIALALFQSRMRHGKNWFFFKD